MPYDPPRQTSPKPARAPLEVELVYNIRSCGTCDFFWPEDSPQPYGPFPSYDFSSNTPAENGSGGKSGSFVWLDAVTRPPVFPNAEVMDGCRKAPIMTIGINPNLTAFSPGKTGASWCYPSFSNQDGTSAWTKYAYYYRYRSVYQEHFDLEFIRPFLLEQGRVAAAKAGVTKAFSRTSDDPSYELLVQYDGDESPSALHLSSKLGQPRYVVLVDANERFQQGDLLAARLDVPGGHNVEVLAQSIRYYMQLVPVLKNFEAFLKQRGHTDARLRIGEDVGQLDMVACATPHWGPQWLGGSSQAVNTIVSNCVHKNAWAIKQVVQSQPAILFLVGQASWNMFRQSFGHLVQSPNPLPLLPEDGPYTLLSITSKQQFRLEFSMKDGDQEYRLSTRLVVTPHFSYDENFVPQFRMNPQTFDAFQKEYPSAVEFLQKDSRVKFQKPPGSYVAVGIEKDVSSVLSTFRQKYPSAAAELAQYFYDPHQMLANVLAQMYSGGYITYTSRQNNHTGFLTRGSGPCEFCVNQHWEFPKGCPYNKPNEKKYSVGFLERVAEAMIKREH